MIGGHTEGVGCLVSSKKIFFYGTLAGVALCERLESALAFDDGAATYDI